MISHARNFLETIFHHPHPASPAPVDSQHVTQDRLKFKKKQPTTTKLRKVIKVTNLELFIWFHRVKIRPCNVTLCVKRKRKVDLEENFFCFRDSHSIIRLTLETFVGFSLLERERERCGRHWFSRVKQVPPKYFRPPLVYL